MKKRLPGVLLCLVFFMGAGMFLYPTIAEQWNKYHQSRAIAAYEEIVSGMTQEDYEACEKKALEYNQKIKTNTFAGDAFSQEEKNMKGTEYWSQLNVNGNGIMGYLSIPKIEQKIPIYHGTSDAVLQIGIGHILGTGLPVGGAGTHCVLAGHRGLPSARLFTDIDQMEIGDKFYLHILDKVLAYEVDRILPMIEKNDKEALEQAMEIEEGQDYITLFTCTPYGVNSHRLLVRGHRVEYHGEEEESTPTAEAMLQSIKDYYMFYLFVGVGVSLFLYYGKYRVKLKGKSA